MNSLERVKCMCILENLLCMKVVSSKDRIYIVGHLKTGENNTHMFSAFYDMELDECIRFSSIKGEFSNFEIAEINDEIYVLHQKAYRSLITSVDLIHKYNPHTKQWTLVNRRL